MMAWLSKPGAAASMSWAFSTPSPMAVSPAGLRRVGGDDAEGGVASGVEGAGRARGLHGHAIVGVVVEVDDADAVVLLEDVDEDGAAN